MNDIAETSINISKVGVDSKTLLNNVSSIAKLIDDMDLKIHNLEKSIEEVQKIKDNNYAASIKWRDNVLTNMNELRKVIDSMETMVNSEYWPIPTYIDLLFGI